MTDMREALADVLGRIHAAEEAAGIARAKLIDLLAVPAQGDGYREGVMRIEHDGFEGTIQGDYCTREGKRGVVLQQVGTRVVHVYGAKWLTAASPSPPASGKAPISRYGDPSFLIVAVDAAINGIECGSSIAPVLECLKAAREQFLAQPPLAAFPPPPAREIGEEAIADYERYNIRNWDGYGAEPITPETVAAAQTFIELLALPGEGKAAPGSSGTIGFEWVDGNTRKLFIDIGPGNQISAYMRCADGRKLHSHTLLPSPPAKAEESAHLAVER